jgi:hypothetical protein
MRLLRRRTPLLTDAYDDVALGVEAAWPGLPRNAK